jgi:uncharacterized protein involved in tolerance to divalent cations
MSNFCVASKFTDIEELVTKNHPYDILCIFAVPMIKVSKAYGNWLEKEMASV